MVTQPKACTRAYNSPSPPPLNEVRFKARADKSETHKNASKSRWGTFNILEYVFEQVGPVLHQYLCTYFTHCPTLPNTRFLVGERLDKHPYFCYSICTVQTPVWTTGLRRTPTVCRGAKLTLRKPKAAWEINQQLSCTESSVSHERTPMTSGALHLHRRSIMAIRKLNADRALFRQAFPLGWTNIPHKVIACMVSEKYAFRKNELQILLALARKTWGFHKFSDRISRSQFRKMTGLDVSAISRALRSLRERCAIQKVREHSWNTMRACEWKIELDTHKWKTLDECGAEITHRTIHAENRVTKRIRSPTLIYPITRESPLKERDKYSRSKIRGETTLKENHNDSIENRKARY